MAVHDDGTLGGDHAWLARVAVRSGDEGVADGVTVPAGDRRSAPVSVATHRRDVVRRLLDRGLSPSALHALLPEFAGLIDDVADPTDP